MNDWGENLVGLWVLHLPTRVLAKAVRYYDGVERRYCSPVNQQVVVGSVVEFEDGSSVVADVEEAFVPLEPGEVQYLVAVQQSIGKVVKACAESGAALGLRKRTAMLLIGAVLRQTAGVVGQVGDV